MMWVLEYDDHYGGAVGAGRLVITTGDETLSLGSVTLGREFRPGGPIPDWRITLADAGGVLPIR